MEENENNKLKKFSNLQLLNFCIGFFGLQFAWQMEIILSGPVTEGLGASPFIFGLIWLAGPVTGIVVQPIIGALSDNTRTRIGRRRPYMLISTLFASVALLMFPNTVKIVNYLQSFLPFQLNPLMPLILAAVMIWIIDASVNSAQGPYRALIPDNMPKEQHSVANSFLSFAIGLGSVITAGTAPFLKWAFNIQMSVSSQFIMAALAFSLGMLWTCLTIKEVRISSEHETEKEENTVRISFAQRFKNFFAFSPEIPKICTVQFFTWIGIMCMFIYFTQYVVHNVFGVPDLTSVSDNFRSSFQSRLTDATNFSSVCFAIFNFICFAVSLPIGILSSKFGNKNIHSAALFLMALSFFGMAFTTDTTLIKILIAVAGIGWASTLALPFAILTKFIGKGSEGSVMGIFNMFIAAPQILVCTVVAWIINHSSFTVEGSIINYHFEYALIIGALVLLIASCATVFIKEKKSEE